MVIVARDIHYYVFLIDFKSAVDLFLPSVALDVAFYLAFWAIFDFKALTEDEVCAMRRKIGEEMEPSDDEKIDGGSEQANQTTGEWSSIRRRTVTVGDHEH